MIAVIDADLIGRKKHRFPNLVCMKISGYYKSKGCEVELKTDYNNLEKYEKVYISKVFTDTPIDRNILKLKNVTYGGTGFYFDKAPNLPEEIEHSFPDYNLYDKFIDTMISKGYKKTEFKEYKNCSIGFLTRGCFRKCEFCVNQKYNKVFQHSPLKEFLDETRKSICLLDDNFLGFPCWKELLNELIKTGKPFKFKQGLDERLLNDEKCEILFNAKYDGDFIFAFDNIKDYDLIESKLKIIRRHTNKTNIKFYVLCGFESTDIEDIKNTFKRIELLFKYKCIPYIMRYQSKDKKPWNDSELRGIYITLARWCNQPSFVKKKSFKEFCFAEGNNSARKYFEEFRSKYSDVCLRFENIKFGEVG